MTTCCDNIFVTTYCDLWHIMTTYDISWQYIVTYHDNIIWHIMTTYYDISWQNIMTYHDNIFWHIMRTDEYHTGHDVWQSRCAIKCAKNCTFSCFVTKWSHKHFLTHCFLLIVLSIQPWWKQNCCCLHFQSVVYTSSQHSLNK